MISNRLTYMDFKRKGTRGPSATSRGQPGTKYRINHVESRKLRDTQQAVGRYRDKILCVNNEWTRNICGFNKVLGREQEKVRSRSAGGFELSSSTTMTKHSKNNTASSVFSYAEYKMAGQEYGTKRVCPIGNFYCTPFLSILVSATARQRIYAKIQFLRALLQHCKRSCLLCRGSLVLS